MRRLTFVLALLALATPSARQTAAPDILIEKNVGARMRDGVVLRADVYRPASPGKRPVLLQRTPYSKNPETPDSQFHRLARAGFVVVVQDTRGRYNVGRRGRAARRRRRRLRHGGVGGARCPTSTAASGCSAAATAPRCNCSRRHSSRRTLVALFPSASYASRYDMVFQGGAFYLGDGLSWSLGQAKDVRRRHARAGGESRWRDRADAGRAEAAAERPGTRQLPLELDGGAATAPLFAPGYFELLRHPSYDRFWTHVRRRREAPAVRGAGVSPHRLVRQPAERHARQFQRTARQRRHASGHDANQRLIVGPWTHARPTADHDQASATSPTARTRDSTPRASSSGGSSTGCRLACKQTSVGQTKVQRWLHRGPAPCQAYAWLPTGPGVRPFACS